MSANDIIKILDELMSRLSGSAQYVFKIAVKQSYIDGFSDLLFTLLFVGIVCFCLKKILDFNKVLRDNKYNDTIMKENIEIYRRIVCWIVLPFAIILGIVFLTLAIEHFINPEYYAIKDIIKMIMGK